MEKKTSLINVGDGKSIRVPMIKTGTLSLVLFPSEAVPNQRRFAVLPAVGDVFCWTFQITDTKLRETAALCTLGRPETHVTVKCTVSRATGQLITAANRQGAGGNRPGGGLPFLERFFSQLGTIRLLPKANWVPPGDVGFEQIPLRVVTAEFWAGFDLVPEQVTLLYIVKVLLYC